MKSDKLQGQSSDDENKKQDLPQINSNKKKVKTLKKLKSSPYLQQYKEKFIRERKVENFKKHWQNFLNYDIIFVKQLDEPLPVSIQMLSQSRNFRIIHYEVKLSLFSLKIKILNITKEDNFIFQFEKEINKGMFGTVYEVRENGKYSAVKELRINADSKTTIELAIKEYSIMKLLAALECGPALHKVFGFDLVISDKCIYFESEKCLSVEEYLSQIENETHFQKDFEKLEESLLEMHSLNICHNDIKPCNILYSLTLRKLVFVDFGFSEAKSESVGYMKEETAKGSFYYSCQDMKNLFVSSKQKGYVDTYYNDFYGLMKSKKTILSMIENSKFSIEQGQVSKIDYEKKFVDVFSQSNDIFQNLLDGKDTNEKKFFDQIFSTSNSDYSLNSDYDTLLISYLLSQFRMNDIENLILKNKSFKNKLQTKLKKYYWVFLQMVVNISVETSYKKLKSIILQNSEISYQTKIILESILDPYFEKSLKGDLQINEPHLKYIKQQQKNRQLFKQRLNIRQHKDLLQRFDNFSKKNPYQFVYQIQQALRNSNKQPKNDQINGTKKCQKQFQNGQSNNLNKIYQLSKLNENQRTQIINCFLELNEQLFHSVLEKIYTKLNISKLSRHSLVKNIQVFKSCFKIAGIQIDYQDYEDQYVSYKDYFVICLNLMIEISFQFMKNFNIQNCLIFIVEEFSKKQNNLFQILKIKSFKKNNTTDLKSQNQIGNKIRKYNYQRIRNFQKSLLLFLKIQPIFSDMNFYTQSKKMIDQLIQSLFQKMTQILEFHQKLIQQKNISDFCYFLNTLFEQLMVFIYQIGLNSFAKAQVNGDIERLSNYFHKIFTFDRIFTKFPNMQRVASKIMKLQSIFYFTKDLSCLLIYRSILPRSLYQKYQILEKTEKFIFIMNGKIFQVQSQHVKKIKNNLFWQHFNQLKNQGQHNKTLMKIDEMFAAGQRIWDEEMIRIFRNVYQIVNNNKRKNQLESKLTSKIFDSFACNNVTTSNQVIKSFTIPIKEFQVNLYEQQYKKNKKISKSHQSEIIFQQIHFFLNLQEDEMNFNKKWYCIRQLINRSLKSYPYQDININYYITKYQQSLQQYECYYKRKIQLFRHLPLNVSIYQFLSTKIQTNDEVNKKVKDSEKISDQNQFWQEIYRQQIIQQYYFLMHLLLNNQTIIKDKDFILKVWKNVKMKLIILFKERLTCSLQFLQLVSCINQLIYNQKIQQRQKNCHKKQNIEKAKQKFFNSISAFLKQCNVQHPQFSFQLKNSNFYMDSLLKIYNQNIKIEKFSLQKAKQSLVNLFKYLVKNNLSYNFFTQNLIYQKFVNSIILFGFEELKQYLDSKIVRKSQVNTKQMFKSQDFSKEIQFDVQNENKEKKQKQLILQKILFQIGTFAQKYLCSNYSKTIMKISYSFAQHLLSVFIRNEENNDNLEERIEKTIKIVLMKMILEAIRKFSLNQLILVYLVSLNSLIDQLISRRSEHVDKNRILRNQGKRQKYFKLLELIRQALKKISIISLEKMQHIVKTYSIQLIYSILMKTNKQISKNNLYLQIKYFKSYRIHGFNDENKINGQKRKDLKFILDGTKTFQKEFKRSLFSKIFEKSTKNQQRTFFLQKFKQKIIQRLTVCC